jgi:hypothetical protein
MGEISVMRQRKTSSRADGRGGWTAGKRRHDDAGGWSDVLAKLRRLRTLFARRPEVSKAALARDVGVDRTTIYRWLAGVDRPPPAMQARVKRWLEKQRHPVAAAAG